MYSDTTPTKLVWWEFFDGRWVSICGKSYQGTRVLAHAVRYLIHAPPLMSVCPSTWHVTLVVSSTQGQDLSNVLVPHNADCSQTIKTLMPRQIGKRARENHLTCPLISCFDTCRLTACETRRWECCYMQSRKRN